jgi:hypothetical protein
MRASGEEVGSINPVHTAGTAAGIHEVESTSNLSDDKDIADMTRRGECKRYADRGACSSDIH